MADVSFYPILLYPNNFILKDYGADQFMAKTDFIRRSINIMIFKQIQFIKFICQILMNFSFDRWSLSNVEEGWQYQQFFSDKEDYKLDFDPLQELQIQEKDKQSSLELKNQKQIKQSTDQEIIERHVGSDQYQLENLISLQKNKPSTKSKRKRIIKPSPYHNFQKHLNTTVKQILTPLPIFQTIPLQIRELAQQIWGIFCKNKHETKKILHFVFNEFNEHLITHEQLSELGFEDIYRISSPSDIRSAKNYLTCIALNGLTNDNINSYLIKRRIKNIPKFKRYVMLFRNELQDGFIKKRFTNKSKKEEMKELFDSLNR